MKIKSFKIYGLWPIVITIFSSLMAWGAANSAKKAGSQKVILNTPACPEGQSRSGFRQPIVNGFESCVQETQFCLNGNWNGPELYPTCENVTKGCGQSPHGSVESGFMQMTTSKGVPCPTGSRTCLNGSWIGPEIFPTCTEM